MAETGNIKIDRERDSAVLLFLESYFKTLQQEPQNLDK